MIEKRYTGIAKQGADVVANPTLDGSEQALNSIQINGENFKIEGGGSGGVEKDSYEFWENYANNILCYQNSNGKGKYITGRVTYEVNSHIEIENYGILNNIENSTSLTMSLDGFMYVDKTIDEFNYFDDYRIGGTFYIGNCTLYSEERSVYAHCYIYVSDGNVYIDFDDGSKITLLPEALQTSASAIYDIINNRHYEC